MNAEYRKGCLQRDRVEPKRYAGAISNDAREGKERDGANDLLERILDRDNPNRAYSNHGAPGTDRMTVEGIAGVRENREELLQSILHYRDVENQKISSINFIHLNSLVKALIFLVETSKIYHKM